MDPEEEDDQPSSPGSQSGQRKGSRIGSAAKGAASGAAKEGTKQAAVQGAKGAVQGAARGAQAGAAAGSAIPVVGTAIGAGVGAAAGAAAGGAAGAAKGGLQGSAQGAVKGAAKGSSKGSGGVDTKEFLKKGTKQIANKAAKAAGPEAVAALKAAEFINKHKNLKRIMIAGSLASNPAVLITVFVVSVMVLVMGEAPSGADPNAPKLTITKSGPTEAVINQELNYQIAVTYPSSAQDIIITDRIPDGTEYIESAPAAKYDAATRTATWNLKDLQPTPGAVLTNVNTTLALKLRATADNSYLVNLATGIVTSSPPVTGAPSEGYVPPQPSSNNCGGKWDFSKWPNQNPLGNYGDPQCNFSKDNLYNLLQTKEPNPEFVTFWFDMIVPVESAGYQPNAFASPDDPTQCSLDCAGAWGLYQMGSSSPPGQAPPAPGKNGPLDRGDVNWETQTDMAIRYNRERLGCNFEYWASAKSIWSKYSC